KNYVTDAQKVVIENTSNTNTGDQDISGIAYNAAFTATKVDKNADITGATKTKITYDAKGLVTAGADATTADIAASTNKNYVTDAQKVVIENTSNTNTGDQDLSGIDNNAADITIKVDKNNDITGDTKTKITYDAKGLVTAGTDATTTDIAEGSRMYYTEARVDANTSVVASTTHSGQTDNPHAVTKTQVGLGNADDTSDANKPVSAAAQTALDLKVDENTAITGATQTKITYDTKGLVTAGADATTADIAASTNKNYVTDAQQTVIEYTSGINTGNQNLAEVIAKNDSANAQIKNVTNPTEAQDAATKSYVDNSIDANLSSCDILLNLAIITEDLANLINAGVSIADLIDAGKSISEFLDAGVSVSDLLAAGVSVSELLAAGVSVSDLLAAGVSVSDLLAAGVSVSDLLAAGVSVSELLAAGVSVSDLFDAGVGVGTLEINGADSTALANAGLIGSVNDVDGNSYKWIKIGNQIWMAENLNLYTPTGSWYNNNDSASYSSVYGRLYDWATVMNGETSSLSNPSGVQGICPAGWHLPSDAEWTELSDYLIANGYGYGGSGNDIAKSLAATSNWYAISTPGTPGNDPANNNSSGFSGLPGGNHYNGDFIPVTFYGFWWSATEYAPPGAFTPGAYIRTLVCDDEHMKDEISDQEPGFSVRCVRD
ncbi:MAG: hypothetical protein HN929_10235, partial [Chloroflexi bacterium]|nr:hypothetical protein [Chloroflexota bacterium]